MYYGAGQILRLNSVAVRRRTGLLLRTFPKLELAAIDVHLAVGAVKPDSVAGLVDHFRHLCVEQAHAALRLFPIRGRNDFDRPAVVHAPDPLRVVDVMLAPLCHQAAAACALAAPVHETYSDAAQDS